MEKTEILMENAITAEEAKQITAMSKEVLSKAIERVNQGIKNAAEGGSSRIGISVPIMLVAEIMRIYTCLGFVTRQDDINANTIIFTWHEAEQQIMRIAERE